jgi:hypothetical protein
VSWCWREGRRPREHDHDDPGRALAREAIGIADETDSPHLRGGTRMPLAARALSTRIGTLGQICHVLVLLHHDVPLMAFHDVFRGFDGVLTHDGEASRVPAD